MSSNLVGRDALTSNPNQFSYPEMSDINITSHGSDLYWAISAFMGFSAIMFLVHAHFVVMKKKGPRFEYVIFHYITAAICFVACIAYFTMASNLGYAAIAVEFNRDDPKVRGLYREIFYVRYIDWVVTTPLLLLDVLLTAGLPWPTILLTILIDEVMIITGLVGALVSSQYKWGYFVFAMVSLFFIAYNVTMVGRKSAYSIKSHGTTIGSKYMLAAGWTIGLWFLYPIAWGLSEGGNVISPDSEAIFYSILDVLAKPGFGALLIWAHRSIEPRDIGIHIRGYDEKRRSHYLDEPRHEKSGNYAAEAPLSGDGAHNAPVGAPIHSANHAGHGPLPANGTQRPDNAAEAIST